MLLDCFYSWLWAGNVCSRGAGRLWTGIYHVGLINVSIDDFEQVNNDWENTKLMRWVRSKLNIGNCDNIPNNVLVYLIFIDQVCFGT